MIKLKTLFATVAAKAVVKHQSATLISVYAVVLPWVLKSCSKKWQENGLSVFFLQRKGSRSRVRLSLESTVWIINYGQCEKGLIFGHIQYILPVLLLGTYFQALCECNREMQFHREHWPFLESQNANLLPRTKATSQTHPTTKFEVLPPLMYLLFLWWFHPTLSLPSGLVPSLFHPFHLGALKAHLTYNQTFKAHRKKKQHSYIWQLLIGKSFTFPKNRLLSSKYTRVWQSAITAGG